MTNILLQIHFIFISKLKLKKNLFLHSRYHSAIKGVGGGGGRDKTSDNNQTLIPSVTIFQGWRKFKMDVKEAGYKLELWRSWFKRIEGKQTPVFPNVKMCEEFLPKIVLISQ